MIKVSKKAQYGMRAMVFLAKNYNPLPGKNGSHSLKKISEAEAIPFDFLEKIVSKLEKASLVKGKKGAGGGYVLARIPRKISAGEIVAVLEKNQKPVDCALCSKASACKTKTVWDKLDSSINKTLEKITLKDLTK